MMRQIPKRTWIHLIYILLSITLSSFAFFNTPNFLLDADDTDYLETAHQTWNRPSQLFSPDRHPTVTGRPVIDLVFFLDYPLFEKHPTPYHFQVVFVHLLASLLLAYTFIQLGVSRKIGLLSGLLFLVNIAHFRAVHWIASIGYPLSFLFSMGVILCLLQFQKTKKTQWLWVGTALVACATLTHPSSISVLGFCFYLALRQTQSFVQAGRHTWSLWVVGTLCVGLSYGIYPMSTQVEPK